MTRDFSLSSVLLCMGGAGGNGYEIGAVLTCHSPSLAMNFPDCNEREMERITYGNLPRFDPYKH